MSAEGKLGGSLSDGKPREKKRSLFRRMLKPDKKIEPRVQQPDNPVEITVQRQAPNPALDLQTLSEAPSPTPSPVDSVPRTTEGHGVSNANINRGQDAYPTLGSIDSVPQMTERHGASDTNLKKSQDVCTTLSPIDNVPETTDGGHGNNPQGLWIQAHDMLKNREKDLLADYEEHLRSCNHGPAIIADPLSTPESIEDTVTQLIESRDGKQWKLPWLDADVKVREQLEKLVKFASWSDDIVKQALSAQPIAALAWSGVSILLPLLSNAMGQTETILKGFNYACDLQRYWRFYEDMYLSKSGRDRRQELLDVLIQLYSQILEYQARVICHLSKASLKRTWWNAKGSYDWEGSKTGIQGKSEACKEYIDAHQKSAMQDNFDREWEQIEELITIQGSMLNVLDEFKQQTERNNQGEKESKLLRELASNYEEDKNFNPKNVEGTCQWFFTDDTFRRWRDSNTSNLLWLSAGPGCGKSVLSRALIDTNRLCTRRTTTTVCYFFFKAGDTSRTQGVDALRAILHQLFLNNPSHRLIQRALEAHEKFGDKLQHAFGELWRILIECAEQKEAGEIICVLDALDECEGRMELIDSLVQFYSQSTKRQSSSSSLLKFLIVSRPYDDVDVGFQKLSEISLYMHFDADEKSPAIREEINLVIDAKVEEIAGSFRKEARDQISKRLKDEDNRTYLWLHLIFDIIKKSPSAYRKLSNIKELLEGLPLGLDGAYESILSRSQNEGQTKLLLEIVLAATTPLTLDEVNTALTIAIHEEKQKRYSSLDEINDDLWQGDFKMTVTNLCGFFVSVHDSKLFFIHQTAREFLTDSIGSCNPTPNKWKGRLNVKKAHGIISRICLSYVSLDPALNPDRYASWAERVDDDSDLHTYRLESTAMMVKPHTFLRYGALNWAFHYASQDDSDAKKSVLDARMLCETTKQAKSWFSVYWFAREPTCTDLCLASYLGLDQVVDEMLRIKNPDVNAQGGHYGNALQAASAKGHEAIVRLLLENGADVDASDDRSRYDGTQHERRTALLIAAEGGHEDIVRLLLDKGADINVRDDNESTALYIAAGNGHEAVVRLLLEEGADINAETMYGGTALTTAAMGGHEAVVRLLLKERAGVKADGTDVYSETNDIGRALMSAAEFGHKAIMQLLVEEGADINTKDENGWTALLRAALIGRDVIARIQLEFGADMKATTVEGQTALHVAADRGNTAVLQLLLDEGADVEVKADYGYTAMHLAAKGGHEAVVRLLLEKGANVETKNDRGETALFIAAKTGHKAAVRLLVEMRADVNTDDSIATALYVAAENALYMPKNGHDVVQLLVEKGANVNATTDTRAETVLILTASAGNEALVHLLLENGADVEAKDDKGWTALQRAVWLGHEAVVRLLLEKGADVDAKDGDEWTEEKEAYASCKQEGWTALFIAARGGKAAIVRLLIEKGADVEARDVNGRSALDAAAEEDNEAVVRLLLEKGATIEARHADGQSVLHVAAKRGHEAVMRRLLEKGTELDAKDDQGYTALHAAALGPWLGKEYTVRELLEKENEDERGIAAPHYADLKAWRGQEVIVRLLLEKGANIEARTLEGCSALVLASQEGQKNVVRVLLEKGADLKPRDVNGRSALHAAAQCGHDAVVRLLLDKGAAVDVTNEQGCTALHVAAIGAGQEAVVRQLLEQGADAAARNSAGRGALDCAAQAGHEAAVRALLETGPDVEARDDDGWTALLSAAEGGHAGVVRQLLDAGAAVGGGYEGWTALCFAASEGHGAVVRVLLAKGAASANAKTDDGWTPLLIAADKGHARVVRLLLRGGADVDARTADGLGAVDVAAAAGHAAVVRVLARHGDPSAPADSDDVSDVESRHSRNSSGGFM